MVFKQEVLDCIFPIYVYTYTATTVHQTVSKMLVREICSVVYKRSIKTASYFY